MAQVGAFRTELLAGEERDTRRHRLWLSAEAAANGSDARVLIHNLSASGLLIESALELDVGEEFEVDLPQAGSTRAQIVWRSDGFYGCQFISPVSGAAVSAARLRSPSLEHQQALGSPSADPSDGAVAAVSPALNPLQKAAVIVGAAVACWAPIIILAVVYL